MRPSQEAKFFITKLLQPDPQDRGDFEGSSTDCILHHNFLSHAYSKMSSFKKIKQEEWVSKFNDIGPYNIWKFYSFTCNIAQDDITLLKAIWNESLVKPSQFSIWHNTCCFTKPLPFFWDLRNNSYQKCLNNLWGTSISCIYCWNKSSSIIFTLQHLDYVKQRRPVSWRVTNEQS